jgi:transcriptional regulator with XRE-family HTH domain
MKVEDIRRDQRLDMIAFGESIVRRREALGWTRYRLSRIAGMSDPYIRALEMGHGKRVGIEVVVRLAKALGTTSDDLLRDAGMPIQSTVPEELTHIYDSLREPERRAWLYIGQALVDLQDEYRELQRSLVAEETVVAEPLAAYDRDLDAGEEWPAEQS